MNNIELNIWKDVAGLALSPSHNRWHIDRVLVYAQKLAEKYGGDIDVITAAVIMHDLGRSNANLRGIDSSDKSVEIARKIFAYGSTLSKDKQQGVISAIAEHDQPDLTPSTIEGRILKDADFLAGFGAWGILRIAMWAAETDGGIPQILQRLEEKMQKRVAGLEFPESRRIAKREMTLVRLYSSLLHEQPNFNLMEQKGSYIVIEGISGSGKDTQAKLLAERISNSNISIKVVAEPTDLYKTVRDVWAGKSSPDPTIKTFLYMADRYQQIKDVVQPALDRGEVVVSIRSYISSILYQSLDMKTNQGEFIDFMHYFVPIPDVVFILDIPADKALNRIQQREIEEGRKLGDFEKQAALEQLRQGYLRLAQERTGENFIIVDAQENKEEVGNKIWNHLVTVGLVS